MNMNKSNDHFDISFVILSWNSEKYIRQCLKSYAESIYREKLTAEFLIVDNGSMDMTARVIEDEIFPGLPAGSTGKLSILKKNLGTTKSRNIALKKAVGNYIVVCDSDTEYKEGNWRDLLRYLENDDVGMVAPCLMYPDGTVQNSVKKFPTLLDKFSKFGKIFFHCQIGGQADFYEDFPWGAMRTADTAISACWVFKKSLLDKVGLLDENIYYSPEDVDYCLRVWEKKMNITYYPHLKILHHTQQISHKKPLSRQSISHFFGLLYYFKKHGYCFSRENLKKRLYGGAIDDHC
jgi:GT2 family glycosyltransferase